MRYFTPQPKLVLLSGMLQELFQRADRRQDITCRELAGILGRIHSLARSHGNIVRVLTRAAQHQLGAAVEVGGWESTLILSQQSRVELDLVLSNLVIFNGQFVQSPVNSVTIHNEQLNISVHSILETDKVMADLLVSHMTDRSFMISHNDTFVQIQDFDVDGSEPLAAIRELGAILRVLEKPPTT
jgi:hypothetical protein